MRPFLDSFEIIRTRSRYGPIETNSILDFETIPKSWENHFAILLPEMSSYIPFTKRFLMQIHISENCLSPQGIQDYCYGKFEFPGKIAAFVETRKLCTKCYLQQQLRNGKPYSPPHCSLPSHFFYWCNEKPVPKFWDRFYRRYQSYIYKFPKIFFTSIWQKKHPKKSGGIQKFSNFSLLPYDFML